MKKMKITLISDNMAMAGRLRALLERELTVYGLPAEKLKENTKLLKDSDAVIFAFAGPGSLQESRMLLRSLSDGGMPVFCITAFPYSPGKKGQDGISFLEAPADGNNRGEALFVKELMVKVKSVYGQVKKDEQCGEHRPSRFVVGIGASTGGPGALVTVLKSLPTDTCGILVAQHMSAGFMDDLILSLDSRCRMKVTKARPGEVIRDGNIYLAPEGCQLEAYKYGWDFALRVTPDKGRFDYCPSVDCLFLSLAECAGRRAMGVLLTGMGDDGARGLFKMREAGACTVGQDKMTSIIYSMPEQAFLRGGVMRQRPLEEIGQEIVWFNEKMRKEPT